MDEAGSIAEKLGEAIQVLQSSQTVPNARKAANEFVQQVREHPLAVFAALRLAAPSCHPGARFFAFRLVTSAACEGKLKVEDQHTADVRIFLSDMLTKSTLSPTGDLKDVPAFLGEKYTQTLANVVVYSSGWPAGWPMLQQQLLECGRTSMTHAVLVLNFFRNLHEVLYSDEASKLGVQHRKALQGHFRESSQDLFKFLALVVTSLFPGCAEVDRAAVLLIAELASGSLPVRAFLDADVDSWLRSKLVDPGVRAEALQALTEMLSKNVMQDFKEAPEKMLKLVGGICELTGHCHAGPDIGPDDYEVHRGLAVLVRDCLECNKGSIEKRSELQAMFYTACINFLKYPSVCVQYEASSLLAQVLRLAFPQPKKGEGVKCQMSGVPSWMRIQEEVMPLCFLIAYRRVPPNFDIFPLPKGFAEAMQSTSDFDSEEDLPGVQLAIKGRMREIMMAIMAVPAAILSALQFLQGLMPRVCGMQPDASSLLAFEAAFTVTECLLPCVKASSGPQALEILRQLLQTILQVQAHSPEHESRRLECLSRAGGALDALAESNAAQRGQEAVSLLKHVFSVIGCGNADLRKKALTTCALVCKGAPEAIRPVCQDLINSAASLLQTLPEDQHILCEALISASNSVQNFEQQQALLRNLLAPLIAQWSGLTSSMSPGKLISALLGERADLHNLLRLLQCFDKCFRASTAPTRPDAIKSGGFTPVGNDAPITVRSPAASSAVEILPGLATLFKTFHEAFPSSGEHIPQGLDQRTSAQLHLYLFALDMEEVRALTSNIESKRNDETDTWTDPLPPPPTEDFAHVQQGRQLLFGIRGALYKCVGATLGVQDGVLLHPELMSMISESFLKGLSVAHPYHVELQMRDAWMVPFSPSGLQFVSTQFRTSFSEAVLPLLLPAIAEALQSSWQKLASPTGEQLVTACGFTWTPGLMSALCTGTVMASRTFVEFCNSLVMHGGVAATATHLNPGAADVEAPEKQGQRKKGKDRTSEAAAAAKGANGKQMTDVEPNGGSSVKTQIGFAQIVFTSQQVLQVVQKSVSMAVKWPDPKTISNALYVFQVFAVRLMSGGEHYQSLREVHIAHPEALSRSMTALRAVVEPIVVLCRSIPTAPAGTSAMHVVVGKALVDFLSAGGQQSTSHFVEGVTSALWPILWGMRQIFVQLCKRSHVQATPGHVASFPALVEVCKLLASLPHASEQSILVWLTTMLDETADVKLRRGALRNVVKAAVCQETPTGRLLA